MKSLEIGILGLQGAIKEHICMTECAAEQMGLNCKLTWVKTAEEVKRINGLIIPGGESTTIGKLARFSKTLQIIKDRAEQGMSVLGTCAGLILMARTIYDRVVGETAATPLGLLDIIIERNAFGRQRESFETQLELPNLGADPFRAIFIRAPSIKEIGPGIEILGRLNSHIVAVQQDNRIGIAFHPELTTDSRFHEYFLQTCIPEPKPS